MQIPNKCPSCEGELRITKIQCRECDSTIEGNFTPCPVCMMDNELKELFMQFMKSRGNVKEVQRYLGVSYPTVRNKMEQLYEHFEKYEESNSMKRKDILKMLKEGQISVDEAADLLKTAKG